MSLIPSSFLVAVSTLLVASASSSTTTFAEAYDSFRCQEVWQKESATNTITACITNLTHVASLFSTSSQRAEIGGILIPLAIVALVIIIYPIFVALRYCVNFCGSNRRRPGYCCYGGEQWDGYDPHTKEYKYQTDYSSWIAFTRSLAYLCFFISFVAMGLTFVGTGDLQKGYDSIFTQLYTIVTWAQAKENAIKEFVQFDNGSFVPPVNSSLTGFVHTAVSGFASDLTSVKNANTKYVDIIKIVAIVFAVLPVPVFALNVVFAVFDCRKCGPCVNTLLIFILVIFYGFISFGCFFIGVVSDRICGERDAALNLQPGLGTWWLRPTCEKISALTDVTDYFNFATKQSSEISCNLLAFHCSSVSPIYNGAAPEKIFYCPQLTNPKTQCTNSTEVSNIFFHSSVIALTGVGAPNCSYSGATCGIKNCAVNCSGAAQQSIAFNLVTSQGGNNDVQKADDLFTSELGNCSALIVTTMEKFTSCKDIKGSVFYVGVGSTLYLALLLCSFFVAFKGQKYFFKPLKLPKKHKASKKSPGASQQLTPETTPRNSARKRSISPGAKYRK